MTWTDLNKRLLILAAGLLLFGCLPGPLNRPQPSPDRSGNVRENSYYYFAQAELAQQAGNLDKALSWIEKARKTDPDSVYLEKEQIFLHLQNDEMQTALNLLREILDKHPEDVKSLMLLANIQYRQDKKTEAARNYQKVLQLAPDRQRIYLVLGKIYTELDQLDKARKTYQKMTEQHPRIWDGYFFLGKIQRQQGHFGAAEKNFKHCLSLEPKLISPRLELIELYQDIDNAGQRTVTVKPGDSLHSLCRRIYGERNSGIIEQVVRANPELENINQIQAGQKLVFPALSGQHGPDSQAQKIVEIYQSIIDDYPDNHEAAINLALHYARHGNDQQARSLLQALGEKAGRDPQVAQFIFQFFIDQKKYAQATQILTGMLPGDPDSSMLHYLLGLVYDLTDKPQAAIKHLSQVQPGTQFHQDARLNTAYLLEETDQTDQALSVLKQMVQNNPDNARLHLFLGSLYERQNEYQKARKVYQQALSLKPEKGDKIKLMFRIGIIYDKLGQNAKLIRQMKKVLTLQPDHASALNYLGYTYAAQGKNLDEAQRLIEKALSLEPDSGYITDSLGWVYYQKGNLEKALKFLKKAVQLEPNDPVLLEHLGDVYRKKGQPQKAIQFYRRSLENTPAENPSLKSKIKSLAGPDVP